MYHKVIQLYVHVYLLFHIWAIKEYWAEFPVLYSWSLLVIYFKYSSVHMSIPNSQSVSFASSPFPGTINLFPKSMSLFVFCKQVCILFFKVFECKWYYIIFVFLCLTYFTFSVIISRSICVAGNGIISFFLTCSIAQSRPTLCHSKDCSPPGSSIHGIFQGRILE